MHSNYSPLRIVVQSTITVANEKKSVPMAVAVLPRFVGTGRGTEVVYFEEPGSSTRRHRPWQVMGFTTPGADPMPIAKRFHERFVAWQDKRREADREDARKEWVCPGVYIEVNEKDTDMLKPKGHSRKARESEFLRDRTDHLDWAEQARGDGNWNPAWDLGRIKLKGEFSPMKRQTWDVSTPNKYPLPSIIAALAMTRYSKKFLMESWGKAWNRKAICTILRECEGAVAELGSGHRPDWNAALDGAAYRLVLKLEGMDTGFKSWLAFSGSKGIVYEGLWGKEEGMTEDLCGILHTCTTAFIKAIYRRRTELFQSVEEEKQAMKVTLMDDYINRMAEKIVMGELVGATRA